MCRMRPGTKWSVTMTCMYIKKPYFLSFTQLWWNFPFVWRTREFLGRGQRSISGEWPKSTTYICEITGSTSISRRPSSKSSDISISVYHDSTPRDDVCWKQFLETHKYDTAYTLARTQSKCIVVTGESASIFYWTIQRRYAVTCSIERCFRIEWHAKTLEIGRLTEWNLYWH